jgi:flavorubredoxin
MVPLEVTKDIWWVGVQNPGLRVFDVVMTTEWGTSYNSYLVKGGEKTALIDSVRDGFFDEQMEGIRQIADPEKIDYIIVNHTEPDHSGSLGKTLELAKNAVVVCTRPAKTLIKELLNKDFECIVVGDGDSIDLGGKKIEFISAPFLHWPDTMFTYIPDDRFLSTCDAFGFHFSAPEVFDDLTTLTDAMEQAQKYYFDVIMSPFKPYVLEAVAKIRGLGIDIIGPSHGPVLRSDPWAAVDRYEKWAQPVVNDPKKIYIGYVSCYGYTGKLAEKGIRGREKHWEI